MKITTKIAYLPFLITTLSTQLYSMSICDLKEIGESFVIRNLRLTKQEEISQIRKNKAFFQSITEDIRNKDHVNNNLLTLVDQKFDAKERKTKAYFNKKITQKKREIIDTLNPSCKEITCLFGITGISLFSFLLLSNLDNTMSILLY